MNIYRFNGSFLSLLIITTAAITLTVAIFAKIFPLLSAKTLYFCQQLISNTLFQIPQTIPNTLVLILIIALALSSLSFLIQVWKTKRLVKKFLTNRIAIPKRIEDIANLLDLQNKIYVIDDRNVFSFASGIFSPKILITTGLIASLVDKELEAVLLHEKAHIENHDPFKMLFGKTVSMLFFFLPVFSEISKNMQASSEMLADWFVTINQREDTHLRNALKKILLTPQVALAPVPSIASPDYLEIRIHKLVNPRVKQSFSLSLKSVITSFLFLILGIFVIQTPVSAFSMENHKEEPSYFMCSSDNACRQECQHNAQASYVTTPEQLFSPAKQEEKNFSSPVQVSESQPLKYK